MSATITGIGSGFDINGWVSSLVSAKQKSLLSPLQTKLSTLQEKNNAVSGLKNKYSTLQSALQTFTRTIYNSSSDMWSNTSITSTNNTYATATSSGSVSAATIDLEIEQVATATTAKSVHSLGAVSKDNINSTKFVNLANGQAKAGKFSMFLDGKEYKIDINSNDTVADVKDKIFTASNGKIQADVTDDGHFTINAYKEATDEDENFIVGSDNKKYTLNTSANLSLGSSADTSNLAAALKLHDAQGTYGYKSSYAVSVVNTDKAMASEESGLGEIKFFDKDNPENPADEGTITINGVDFKIDKNTSFNTLISRINGNSDTNVKASYDSLTNKLILTSTETGQNNISLSESGTNLLNVLGLTEGEGDNEIIAKDSQTLGQNAIVHINGNKVISTSNTITGESSGIANLSITVKKQTSAYSKDADDDKKVTLDISPDYTAVKDALKTFVNAYNDVVETTKNLSSSSGKLAHNSSINSLMSSMRSVTSMYSDNGGMYTMLSQIGIATTNTDTIKLSIDESKLDEALSKNFDSVKSLLSDGYIDKTDNGIFDNLLANVSGFLDVEKGFFAQQSESIQSQITSVNTRIERANARLTKYEQRVSAQFNKMDQTIANLNSQLSTFASYFS